MLTGDMQDYFAHTASCAVSIASVKVASTGKEFRTVLHWLATILHSYRFHTGTLRALLVCISPVYYLLILWSFHVLYSLQYVFMQGCHFDHLQLQYCTVTCSGVQSTVGNAWYVPVCPNRKRMSRLASFSLNTASNVCQLPISTKYRNSIQYL